MDSAAERQQGNNNTIGTRVAKIGRSSVTLEQAIFQHGQCVATGSTVIVQVDAATRRSAPLSGRAISRFAALMQKSD